MSCGDQYLCGIYRSARGALVPFSLRNRGDTPVFHRRVAALRKTFAKDGNIILEERIVEGKPAEIQNLLKDLLNAHERKQHLAIHVGSVIEYCDGAGVHAAVILRLGIERSFMLFATSNPDWSPWSRKITKEEYALLGYPEKAAKPTYFAPVIRDNEFMHATHKEFPKHRVDALLEEFGSFAEG